MDLRIASIEGSEVLDSRGNPTAAVEVTWHARLPTAIRVITCGGDTPSMNAAPARWSALR